MQDSPERRHHRELLAGIDIGGTKLALGLAERGGFEQEGVLLMLHKEAIGEPGTPDGVIPRAVDLLRRMAAEAGGEIAAAGISIGGPLEHETGTVVNFPHLPGWRNIRLAALFERELGVPAQLDNDANLGALAEHRFGAGRGLSDMVYITVSTGIGGGVIVDGRLVHGVGTGAGEIGHVTVQTGGPRCACGNRGCLEMMASGRAISRRTREAIAAHPDYHGPLVSLVDGDLDRITPQTVLQAQQMGDELAWDIWDETVEYLAIGIGSIVHVLAPQAVIIGGGVAQAGDALIGPLRERLRHHVGYVDIDRIRVVAAETGHDSALIGSLLLAANLRGRP